MNAAPELTLLIVELLAALGLAALWFSDRDRAYMLWWATAHAMLPLASLQLNLMQGTATPTSAAVLLLSLTMSLQAVALLAGVRSYRGAPLSLPQAGAAILILAALLAAATLLHLSLGRLATSLSIIVALLLASAMLWPLGRFERVAATCMALRALLATATVVWLSSGSPAAREQVALIPSFTMLLATGTVLALLIAAYQRSLSRLRSQYRILELGQELTAELQGVADEPQLAQRVLAVLTRRLHWQHAAFLSPTLQPMTFRTISTLGVTAGYVHDTDTITIPAGGLVYLALSTLRVQHTSDLSNDSRVSEPLRNHRWVTGLPSQVVIPIAHNGDVLSLIVLRDTQRRELRANEVRMLESLGQVIGLSLANARSLRELAFRADHDALTGLGNRAALHEFVNTGLRQYPDRRGAVMLLDLDHFKQVNDALGHAVGDQLLQALAQRLRHYLTDRPAALFRLGGDEFVILHRLDNDDPANALPLAGELADVIAEPLQIGDLSLRTPASIGVAISPINGSDSHELLRCADVAMYHAKQHGAGVTLYSRDIDAHKLEHLTLLSAVNAGLENNEFELFYQPFIDLASGAIDGCEALIRWRHPTLGLIGAAEFMPLIEATDLIRAITRRVIDIAMRTSAHWQQLGSDGRIAINLSARNLLDPELPDYLLDSAARHRVEPRQIQLEITETILIKDPASAEIVMRRLTDAGFTLALDDFGTGYSSLAYLARFPLRTLKIDRSFVRDMLAHAQSRTIVESTIALARGLGLRVTAEGVEQQAEADLLRELGCDCAQGFLFSRPLPEAQLLALQRNEGVTPPYPGSLTLQGEG